MQYGQRRRFDFLMINHCLNRNQWTAQGNQDEYLNSFAACLHLVTRAETIFRSHLLNPRPGEIKWYPSGLQSQ